MPPTRFFNPLIALDCERTHADLLKNWLDLKHNLISQTVLQRIENLVEFFQLCSVHPPAVLLILFLEWVIECFERHWLVLGRVVIVVGIRVRLLSPGWVVQTRELDII